MALLHQPKLDDEQLLSMIRKSMVNKQKKRMREQNDKTMFDYRKPKVDQNMSFNKEETEAIMEKLMNRIVSNPKLGNEDSELNQRIEKIFNLEAFQKMVENADIFQDLSSSSIFSNSQILQKSVMLSQNTTDNRMMQQNSEMNKSQTEDSKILGKEEHDDSLFKPDNDQSISNVSDKSDVKIKKKPEIKQPKSKPKPVVKKDEDEAKTVETQKKDTKDSLDFKPTDLVYDVDEYDNNEDPGFIIKEISEVDFDTKCEAVAEKYNYPDFSYKPSTNDDKERLRKKLMEETDKKKKNKEIEEKRKKQELEESKDNGEGEDEDIPTQLPKWVKFVPCDDDFYPAEFNGVVYDCYNLKVVFDREKTGFEETREFQIVYNSIIAGRYQVMEYLGSAAFSKAIRCYDLHTNEEVCMKIIENNKDYFDQSIDEIKLLRYIKNNCEDCDRENIIKVIDFFYHKEHLFIVTELLKDNLYEFYKYNREQEDKLYFTLGRLQKVTKQILHALDFIHNLHLIHCDLKPENILIKSYSKCEIKVIDLGSSCFIHDHLSSYVQSRSYRAPEVILGCKYDYKIDIWSLGCIVAELFTGYVLFQNESVVGLLARVLGIIGPIPEHMIKQGKLVEKYFTKHGILFQEAGGVDMHSQNVSESTKRRHRAEMKAKGPMKYNLLIPKKTNLRARMGVDEPLFIDFLKSVLEIDPEKRLSAKQALAHKWLSVKYPEDD